MAFKLYKSGNGTGEFPIETLYAEGAIAAGMPVYLRAGDSGESYGKVSQLAGGSAATELVYGVAVSTAADEGEVQVIPALPGSLWLVDAAADSNVTSVAQDNYLASTTLLLTVGASTNQGKKCHIIGVKGVTGDRVYICRFTNVSGV